MNNQRTINLNEKKNSFNLFVSIENKENEYLFAFNSYISLIVVELYDLNSNNNEYYKLDLNNFLDIEENIDNYEITLLKSKHYLSYFIAFIPKFTVTNNMIGNKFIKKFNFKSFDNDAYKEYNCIDFGDYLNYKIMNVLFMDEYENLVVLYAKENTEGTHEEFKDYSGPEKSQVFARRIEIYEQFNIKIYDKELNTFISWDEIDFPFMKIQLLYFKSICRKWVYFFFIYF